MYFFILTFSTLILNIALDSIFVGILTNSINVISTRPNRSSPQKQFYFGMQPLYFSACYRLHHLYNSIRSYRWNTLHQKVYVVIVASYFNENYFVPFFNLLTGFFQRFFNCIGKQLFAIFNWTNQVIKQQILIMTFYYMFAHKTKLTFFVSSDSRVGVYLESIKHQCRLVKK